MPCFRGFIPVITLVQITAEFDGTKGFSNPEHPRSINLWITGRCSNATHFCMSGNERPSTANKTIFGLQSNSLIYLLILHMWVTGCGLQVARFQHPTSNIRHLVSSIQSPSCPVDFRHSRHFSAFWAFSTIGFLQPLHRALKKTPP